MEIWRDIEGYEGKYAVSNYGNVKSLNYHREQREKVLLPKVVRGYLQVGLRKNGKKVFHSIHRLVAKAFIPKEGLEFLQVNHIDLNKQNNFVENLEWTSAKENTAHAIKHGAFKNGAEKLKLANKRRQKPIFSQKRQ